MEFYGLGPGFAGSRASGSVFRPCCSFGACLGGPYWELRHHGVRLNAAVLNAKCDDEQHIQGAGKRGVRQGV